MRSSKCPDGKRRILTKIEVPMDVEDIAGLAWAAIKRTDKFMNSDEDLYNIALLNKRELLRLAKSTVKTEGTAETQEYPSSVLKHVKRMFPEVDQYSLI